jgi:hypothetical protein
LTTEPHLELHPAAKGFAGVLDFGDYQFQSVGRRVFLAHELGHYFTGFGSSFGLESINTAASSSPTFAEPNAVWTFGYTPPQVV